MCKNGIVGRKSNFETTVLIGLGFTMAAPIEHGQDFDMAEQGGTCRPISSPCQSVRAGVMTMKASGFPTHRVTGTRSSDGSWWPATSKVPLAGGISSVRQHGTRQLGRGWLSRCWAI
jgi:hypothetical protein